MSSASTEHALQMLPPLCPHRMAAEVAVGLNMVVDAEE